MQVVESLKKVPLLPSLVRTTRALRTRYHESKLGIETTFEDALVKPSASEFNDHRHYEAMEYPCIHTFLRALRVGPADVVYDIGCGKGRVLCVAAKAGVKKCVGIELCHDLAEQARRNAQTMHGPKAPIEIQTADAALADYSEGTVYCLFNSFGAPTMKRMLERIRQSLETDPRHIRIGYACPDFAEVLEGTRWLRKYGEVKFLTKRWSIQLWENTHR
jgi:cyclopropane fatty-acyl-phospholipid synthase-like methyltransferase